MSIETLFIIFFFIFGTIVGSFLNVLVLRYNTGQSIVKGRSGCFSCGQKLGPMELIPILSFVLQGGKCVKCHSKISWQYPVVEFLTGVLFMGVFLKWQGLIGLLNNQIQVGVGLLAVSVLLAITVYDIKHKIIPDALVLTFSVLALLNIFLDYMFMVGTASEIKTHLISYLVAGPALALPLFLIWLFSKGQWMGLGDPKLVLGIGWFLGPILGLSAVILAFWIGAVYGLLLIALSHFHWHGLKINRKSELPFAPFLILGFFLVYFFNLDVLGLAFLIP